MRTTSPVTAVAPDAITVETSASGSTTGGCVGVLQAASSQTSSAARNGVLFIHDLLSVPLPPRTTSVEVRIPVLTGFTRLVTHVIGESRRTADTLRYSGYRVAGGGRPPAIEVACAY